MAIYVADEGGPSEPAVIDAAENAESGRGLRTVSLLASGWGWFGDDRSRTVAALCSAGPPRGRRERPGPARVDRRPDPLRHDRRDAHDPDAFHALAGRNAAALDPYSPSFLRTAGC